jgi:hypothetical protein
MKKATKKRAKKPSPKRQQMIVLVDAAGNYYEIPRATVQRGKVSEPRKISQASLRNSILLGLCFLGMVPHPLRRRPGWVDGFATDDKELSVRCKPASA